MLARVPSRLVLVVVVLLCWLTAHLWGLQGVQGSSVYLYATSVLLAIGLYGSTYGIDLAEAGRDRRLIITAVTVGVLLKAAIIGGVLFLATQDPLFLLLGVAVAQIDPLSVATILGDNRMSDRAKAILASWASFDDPLTVVLVIYAAALATDAFGLASHCDTQSTVAGLVTYGVTVAANLALAGVAVAVWRLLKDRQRPLAYAILLALAAVAVWQFLMLGVAIAGLFIRPAWLASWVERLTQGALFVAGGLLGLLLVNGISIGYGILLGVMAFVAQVVVGLLLTRGLSRTDRVHLALAQQNGITAIILSLRLEAQFVGSVAVVAPAILVTNVLHFVVNWVADRFRSRLRLDSRPADEPAEEAGRSQPGRG